MGDVSKDNAQARTACTECSRRKQKCNREWPCNHCQKRKVADKCRFKDANQPAAEKAAQLKLRKRRLNHDASTDSTGSELEIDEAEGDGIDALGYMPSHVLYELTAHDEIVKSSSHEFMKDPKIFPSLERALQNFLNNVNYHYYIIYPPSFLEQYQQWWDTRADNRPLSVQWTCLLLMVCACASQYTDEALQRKLEVDLGDTIQRITEQYHEAARELGSTIPIGYSHLINVQQLLHSCYWFKSEARFVECWHVLNSAIREAQELSIHQESKADPMPEFELEICRRVWQISALLGRPMIIDRSECDVKLPSLVMEGTQHSPLTHMKLQSGLIRTLYDRFGLTRNVTEPEQVQEYQGMVKEWIKSFPPPFDVHSPDKALDVSCPWIVLHRHYIRTMAFSMLLDPIRAFLARPFTINAEEAELKIRSDGIEYCLELMVSLKGFFDWVYPRDSKFHFVLFCIFDTSTVLCSAVLHDEHHTLPMREEVFKAIDDAHAMLQRLRMVTKSARTSYGILSRIIQRLPRTNVTPRAGESPAAKRARVTEVTTTPQSTSTDDSARRAMVSPPVAVSVGSTQVNPLSTTLSPVKVSATADVPSSNASHTSGVSTVTSQHVTLDPYTALPPYVEYQPQPTPLVPEVLQTPVAFEQTPVTFEQTPVAIEETPVAIEEQVPVFSSFSEDDLGELATLWHFESLDFNFLDAEPPM
ncbi:hypothetical protein G7Z17_g9522 [Cylindrodendrum hubeiense]|uniref:Zn(2)-C6 fungal-type domain-containing protein n=1 Tax=Cylindrodendrum hubeiense TaxID=595255 RepID=A0A9P5H3T3_9HYPO|nr:hypothetical protein G7Z17_g9522 [Cylindrodendrum hubeiense]